MIDESKFTSLLEKLEQQSDDVLREFSYRCYAKILERTNNPTSIHERSVEAKRLYALGDVSLSEYSLYWIIRDHGIDDAMAAIVDYCELAFLRNDPDFYDQFDKLSNVLSEIIETKRGCNDERQLA